MLLCLASIGILNQVLITSLDALGDGVYLRLEGALLLLFLLQIFHLSFVDEFAGVLAIFILHYFQAFFVQLWLEKLLLLVLFLQEGIAEIFVTFLLVFDLVLHKLVESAGMRLVTEHLGLVQVG
jgi:hypothetical protein